MAKIPWAYLLAGPAFDEGRLGLYPKNGTGSQVRTLVAYADICCRQSSKIVAKAITPFVSLPIPASANYQSRCRHAIKIETVPLFCREGTVTADGTKVSFETSPATKVRPCLCHVLKGPHPNPPGRPKPASLSEYEGAFTWPIRQQRKNLMSSSSAADPLDTRQPCAPSSWATPLD